MSYTAIAQAAQDSDLRLRIAACLSSEGHLNPHPLTGADAIQWAVAGQSGISDAYSYAVDSNVTRPGKDPAVITDAALKTAVLAALG